MRAIFFDTETTGLPKDKSKLPPQGKENWPDLVSVSWVVTEESKIVKGKSYIVQPEGYSIPLDSIRIHGITNDMANMYGKPIDQVLGEFIRDVLTVDVLVGHNLEFDRNVIHQAVLYRCKVTHALKWPTYTFCTMEGSRNLCKLPLLKPSLYMTYKPPRLSELYNFVFKSNPPEELLHTSLGDVMVLVAIFFKVWTLEQVASYARGAIQNQDSQ